MSDPNNWKIEFKKVGFQQWEYLIDNIVQGCERSRQDCLKRKTEITQGHRPLKVKNEHTKNKRH